MNESKTQNSSLVVIGEIAMDLLYETRSITADAVLHKLETALKEGRDDTHIQTVGSAISQVRAKLMPTDDVN
ncbi:hypothetical protein CHU32_10150 [Superficieibacter electus]|uniref:Uncharacterized protein n=1 Tax=Superficieibacter electus TaxID=2022662 RepID=A0A2P5GQW3_9ENTR|nr:hypothetical protein [Superficieibacter electus]POP43430.1 hypothetical protein CHU33_16265 [Superficieibacter electus]POP48945.1 hypothetical protein CHU32_10150 [Superficieibacter electus]